MFDKVFKASVLIKYLLGLALILLFFTIGPQQLSIEEALPKDHEFIQKRVVSHLSLELKVNQAKFKPTSELVWKKMFDIAWGEEAPALGGKAYDPGSGNGISGGAMPLELRINSQGDSFISDGYGPRMVQLNSKGELIATLNWKLLRPDHFHYAPALSGFRAERDMLGQWHVLDTEKRRIYCYDDEGRWIKTHFLDSLLADQYVLHDVHPVFAVAGKDHYFLQLTVSDPRVSPGQVLTGIPVREATLTGLWLDACFGISTEVSPDLLPFAYGYHQWHIRASDEHDFLIQREEWQDNQWRAQSQWIPEGYQHSGGDLIGLDDAGILYWWADRNAIACLDTINHHYEIWSLPRHGLYHPAAVHPGGGVVLLEAEEKSLSLYYLSKKTD
jgi:hypothetical protein